MDELKAIVHRDVIIRIHINSPDDNTVVSKQGIFVQHGLL